MKLKHEDYGQMSVVSVQGDLNADELEPFKRLVSEKMEQSVRDFVLDLSEVEFLDSQALETLIWLQEQVGERLGQVRLAAVTDNVRKVLQITRVERHFDAYPDVDSAVKSLR